MRLDSRFRMSLSNNPEQPEKGINRSETNTMVLSDEHELPSKVANVSRDELRKYAQCKRVGNYLLGRTVGEGSFAKVKEAIHILTGEKVAIKIIDKNRARKDRYVSKNMRREARLLQMIRHPHIVQLLEIVETSQCYYLVFEFAHGGDLMDHICKRKKLEEDEVRKFIRQIISAVEYLHRLGIMHRDLKVENLLLDGNKNIKIIDFGLSNTIYSPDPNNENHCTTQCGSPAYAAPELLVRNDYGPQIDVWSIGVNLYAMLTGRLPYTVEPFHISTLYNKMLKRQMNPVPEHLSEACKEMIYQLLNPDPKERLHILEAVRHPWITMDEKDPLALIPCPNYLHEEDLDDRILDHVEEQLKLNSDDVIRDVIQNKATKNSCVYHLLVCRLERYERDQRKVIKSPPPSKQVSESKVPSNPEYVPSSSPNHHNITQKNGLMKLSSPKTHIMENPFKTIRVALARQKKVAKNEEKSKSGKSSTQESTTSNSTTTSDGTNKPKLCTVKRVALVKFAPVRRSFRGLTSGPRNSPKAGRRKTYFEGLQQRRKSPKVRRRHVEPDDSLSSNVSTPRRTSIDITDNIRPTAQSMRIEDQINNNTVAVEDSKTILNNAKELVELKTSNIETVANEKHSNKDCETNASDTITHLYTEKGVVLKRDSLGAKENINYEQEHATVQHHVFHSEQKTGNNGIVKGEQGCQRVNVVNDKQGMAESGSLKPEMVNAKISSMPRKMSAAKQTSQSQSISHTSKDQLKTKQTTSKQISQKQVTPRRTPYRLDNSSKIPVMAGKNSLASRQFPMPSTRPTPKTATSSTMSNKNPGTVRKNDVARLADKYDKCVSVIVVDRSEDIGASSSANNKNSIPVGKSSLLNSKTVTARRGSDSFSQSSKVAQKLNNRNAIKGRATKVECAKNELKRKNELSEKTKMVERRTVCKVSKPIIKERDERLCTNLKLDGKNTKENVVEAKRKEITRENGNRNGLQSQKSQEQQNAKSSLVKSTTENESRTSCMNKNNSKQTVERTRRKISNNDGTGKAVSTTANTKSQCSSIKSQQTKDTKSWTGDERRKISNYKKTNEPGQKTSSVVKSEAKTITNARGPDQFKKNSRV